MSDQNHTTAVEYREIPGFPGYRVGSDGSIWSRYIHGPGSRLGDTWKQMTATVGFWGYPQVSLRRNGKKYSRTLHPLVLLAFSGPKPAGGVGRHLDGNPLNNAISNLAWGTQKQNAEDRLRHGRYDRGSRHPNAKLDEGTAQEIRRLHREGWQLRAIGRKFGVSETTIANIVTGRTWAHC